MKHLVLVKQHSCIQLGHLYEHLFCNEIKKMMYKKKLYANIDYTLQGLTYDRGGIIEVDLNLISPEAEKLEHQIKDMSLKFNDNLISLALKQISAEESSLLAGNNKKSVLNELTLLNNQKWQQLGEMSLIDSRKILIKDEPIKLSESTKIRVQKVFTRVTLDNQFSKNNRDLLPLFFAVVQPMLYTAQDQLSIQYGGYREKISFNNSIFKAELKILGEPSTLKVNEMLNNLLTSINYQIKNHLPEKVIARLHEKTNDLFYIEDFQCVGQETGIYIGLNGWKKIANLHNVSKLLSHTKIELRIGKNKIDSYLNDYK